MLTAPMTDRPAGEFRSDDTRALRAPTSRRAALAFLLMCLAVVAVYFPLRADPGDNTQSGGDFHLLHARRMAFAAEHVAAHGSLPGWYPRDLIGAPFWANVQSFPFIPNRLALFAVPPLYRYTAGVMLGAVLAAAFTFGFARSLRLSPVASAVAGWTFACAGFYASRVIVGVLPLLEAYPALPLLLWLVELNVGPAARARRRRPRLALAGLALASGCVALAGHPQLGLYAFVVAGAYLFVRAWPSPRRMAAPAGAMGLGVACAAFVLVPMFLLVGRSTRTLTLEHDPGDVAFPYERIAAIALPWRDGKVGDASATAPQLPHFPSDAYVLDTNMYVGLLPLAVALALLGRALYLRRRPGRVGVFVAAAAVVAFVTALPPFHEKVGEVSAATLLRSPSRQTYVTTFGLAMGLGAAVHLALRAAALAAARRSRRAPGTAGLAARFADRAAAAVAVLLAAHAADLAWHARAFVRTAYMPSAARNATIETELREKVGDGRIAIDYRLAAPFNRRIDDVGFFDSVILARPYLTVLALNKTRPTYNVQRINGSQMNQRTLAAAGVRLVMTPFRRPDLTQVGQVGDVPLYAVANPSPRAAFLPAAAARFLPPGEMRPRMRDGSFDPQDQLMLPSDGEAGASTLPATPAFTRPAATRPATGPGTAPANVAVPAEYVRPNSDEIVVRTDNDGPGYLRVLETFDPGWRAELNGRPVEVLAAEDTFLAVALPAGANEVRFTYHTPGATAGLAVSLISLLGLGGLLIVSGRRA